MKIIIMPGRTIGKNIIGFGFVVTKYIGNNEILIGVPNKYIKSLINIA